MRELQTAGSLREWADIWADNARRSLMYLDEYCTKPVYFSSRAVADLQYANDCLSRALQALNS